MEPIPTHQTEEDLRLRLSEERYEALVKASNQCVWTAQSSGTIKNTPEARTWWETLTGRPVSRPLTQWSWLDAILPEDQSRIRNAWQSAVQSGRICSTGFRVQAMDGSLRHVALRGVPLLDGQGKVREWVGTFQDVTEERRARQALWESEARFRQLADAMPQIVFAARPDGYREYFNHRWYVYTGLSPESSMGDGWIQALHPEDRPRVLETWHQAVKTDDQVQMEYRLRNVQDHYRWFLSRAAAIRDEKGSVIHWYGTSTDIDERKRAADVLEERFHSRTQELRIKEEELRQAQKLEAIGHLAGGVAHDFNNLLTGIMGVAEEVRHALPAEDPKCKDLDQILKASQKAFALTKQLLAFGRRQMINPVVVDINERIQDLAKLLTRVIGEHVRLSLDLQPVEKIKIDPSQLEQIILNLALNARDAMPMGGILTIRSQNIRIDPEQDSRILKAPAGAYVMLEVADTGIGMNDEILAHIFEPFYTTKGKEKGTGLGLSTVYGIIQQNQGDIEVHSKTGHGTSFKMYFPITHEKGEVAMIPDAKPAQQGQETILVVEDEAIVRRVMVRKLKKSGYQVLEAASPREALAMLDKNKTHIDLVLTDVIMPEMNGRQMMQHISQKLPGVQAVYISGYPQDAVASQGILEPGIHYVEKAAFLTDLLPKIRSILDSRC